MSEFGLFDEIRTGPGGPTFRDRSLEDWLGAIAAGPDHGLDGRATVTLLGAAILAAPPGPTLTRGEPDPRVPRDRLEFAGLAPMFSQAPAPIVHSLAAALLLLYDHWDASHDAAQLADDQGESRFAPWWHAIAHRREPDAFNANYWFRRVGRPELFARLGAVAQLIPQGERAGPFAEGRWDPPALISYCALARPDTPEERIARELQRLEMTALLQATLDAVTEKVSHR